MCAWLRHGARRNGLIVQALPLLMILVLSWRAVDGADVPSPWASLRSAQSIECLRSLGQPLADHSTDQHLLGVAIMAYANLALMGDAELDGAFGPWLNYARRLAVIRQLGRDGRTPSSLDELAPELWIQLLDGDAQGVERALALWPAQAKSPMRRALHALATRDWRELANEAHLTPHERYALLVASSASGVAQYPARARIDDPTLSPSAVIRMRCRVGITDDMGGIVRDLISDIVALLSDPRLDAVRACDSLRLLIAAMKLEIAETSTRSEMVEMVFNAMGSIDVSSPDIIIALMKIIEGLRDRPHSSVGSGSVFFGAEICDIADWYADRLQESVTVAYRDLCKRQRSYQKRYQMFTAPLIDRYPESMTMSLVSVGCQGAIDAEEDRAPDACFERLSRTVGSEIHAQRHLSDPLYFDAIALVATKLPDRARDLFIQLLSRQRQSPAISEIAHIHRPHLMSLLTAAELIGETRLVRNDLHVACALDPWNADLGAVAERWSPSVTMLQLRGFLPNRTWIAPSIDDADVPVVGNASRENCALRWHGYLRISHPGRYVLATESGDGSKLVVGEHCIDNSGMHPVQTRSMTVEFQAGLQPLIYEYYHATGPAGCRLLWMAPGEERLHAIPESALLHGVHEEPGLDTEYFALGPVGLANALCPSPGRYAELREMPYRVDIQRSLGRALFDAHSYAESMPFLQSVVGINAATDSDSVDELAMCLLFENPPDVTGYLSRVHVQAGIPTDLRVLPDLVDRMERLGIAQQVLDALRGRGATLPHYDFVSTALMLSLGQFKEAATSRNRFLASGSWASLPPGISSRLVVEHLIFCAMYGRAKQNAAEVYREVRTPVERAAVDVLLGNTDWPGAAWRLANAHEKMQLEYYHALWDLACGAHDQAQMRFGNLDKANPSLPQTPTITGIIEWYKLQTPAMLKALPHVEAHTMVPVAGAKNDDL